ncbi:MAG: DegT/DnrJ/EryC1/StrS family aminotransferase, partial [Gallionella sp.]
LEQADAIIAKRRQICSAYTEQLASLQQSGTITLPKFDRDSNGHMFYILLNSLDVRSKLIVHLKESGILPVFHYVPLHSSPAGRKVGRVGSTMVQTDGLSDRLLRLPLYFEMSDTDIERICGAIHYFFRS